LVTWIASIHWIPAFPCGSVNFHSHDWKLLTPRHGATIMPDPHSPENVPTPSENPYQAPTAYGAREEVLTAQVSPNDPEHLRRVAIYQKGVLIAVAFYLMNIVLSIIISTAGWQLPPLVALPLALATLSAFIGGVVSVGLLGARLHGVVVGLVFAICSFVPCVNLIMLFVVNQQANGLLTSNGIHVGLLGARMSGIRALATAKSPFAN